MIFTQEPTQQITIELKESDHCLLAHFAERRCVSIAGLAEELLAQDLEALLLVGEFEEFQTTTPKYELQ